MFDIIILNEIPTLSREEYCTLLSIVAPEKQERIRKFHRKQDAYNCLLGDVLARTEICRVTGLSNHHLRFSTNAYGKPLLNNDIAVHFNISHAGHYIAFAISDEPVGIDIEMISPVDLKIAKHFFTPAETDYIMADRQVQRFFEVWTKKESRIKWEGKGLSMRLSSFNVFDIKEQNEIHYHQGFCDIEAICYACSRKKRKPNIRIITTYTLIRDCFKIISGIT